MDSVQHINHDSVTTACKKWHLSSREALHSSLTSHLHGHILVFLATLFHENAGKAIFTFILLQSSHLVWNEYDLVGFQTSRSQWPSGPRRGSAAALLLGLRVRIPPGAWMFACCECCVLSGSDICDGPIPRPEESYRLWCVIVWDQMNNNPLHLTMN